MEPSAFAHFPEMGEFPEGTFTALVVYIAVSGVAPAPAGQVALHPVLRHLVASEPAGVRIPSEVLAADEWAKP